MRLEKTTQENIIHLSQKWWLVALIFVFLFGVGWFGSDLIPSSYISERTVLVYFNPDGYARLPDDWKNWQMRQLDALAFSDGVLEEALNNMHISGDFDGNNDLEPLESLLDLHWLSVGEWIFIAEGSTPESSQDLVNAWVTALYDTVESRKTHSEAANALSKQVNILIGDRVNNKYKLALLQTAAEEIRQFTDSLTASGSMGDEDSQQLLWRIYSVAATFVNDSSAAQEWWENKPMSFNNTESVVEWLQNGIVIGDQYRNQKIVLEGELNELIQSANQQLVVELSASEGVSINLTIDINEEFPITTISLRNPATDGIILGLTGIFSYLFIAILKWNTQKREQSTQ